MATTSNDTLHDAVDALALKVEERIRENRATLAEVPEFPMGRRARSTNTIPALDTLIEDV